MNIEVGKGGAEQNENRSRKKEEQNRMNIEVGKKEEQNRMKIK